MTEPNAEPKTERKGFTNGKPFVVTQKDLDARWGGIPTTAPESRFRCFLCGGRFALGDTIRWVYLNGPETKAYCGNQWVCAGCDGADVIRRIESHYADGMQRFWWLFLG